MKQNYEPPVLTIVTFKVEHGFETSSIQSMILFGLFTHNPEEDLNQAASYTENHWEW